MLLRSGVNQSVAVNISPFVKGTVNAGSTTVCIAQTSITTGPDVVVDRGGMLELISPATHLQPCFRAGSGGMLKVEATQQP